MAHTILEVAPNSALHPQPTPSYMLFMDAPFGYPGGKRELKKRLLELIPPHKIYVEVFCGSAKLLFAKEPSHWEIINDAKGDLINFFRVAKHRPVELAEALEHEVISPARFVEFRAGQGGTEIERAVRFFYLVRYSFGSQGQHFALTRARNLGRDRHPVHRDPARVREILSATAKRLRQVLVENRDFADIFQRYDHKETFFYCDPPYTSFGNVGQYQPMTEARHREFLGLAGAAKGRVLISYDDSPLVRASARQNGLYIRRVTLNYSMPGNGPKKVSELLISNYALPRFKRRQNTPEFAQE